MRQEESPPRDIVSESSWSKDATVSSRREASRTSLAPAVSLLCLPLAGEGAPVRAGRARSPGGGARRPGANVRASRPPARDLARSRRARLGDPRPPGVRGKDAELEAPRVRRLVRTAREFLPAHLSDPLDERGDRRDSGRSSRPRFSGGRPANRSKGPDLGKLARGARGVEPRVCGGAESRSRRMVGHSSGRGGEWLFRLRPLEPHPLREAAARRSRISTVARK